MRISDWSSDVCSSDLDRERGRIGRTLHEAEAVIAAVAGQPAAGHRIDADIGGCIGGAGPRRRAVGHRFQQIAVLQPDGVHYAGQQRGVAIRSEEHTSELQSLMRSSYAVFCLKK